MSCLELDEAVGSRECQGDMVSAVADVGQRVVEMEKAWR